MQGLNPRVEYCVGCHAHPTTQCGRPDLATTKMIESEHAGVIAWSREANPAIGEYGEPTILYQAGEVPDME
ncbi:hypothetical protein AA2016_6260 (plasmid) [Aminobacter aminovorans]|jgi:hypothetical protein|uniref:Uncharacterized protein n=1 Tax=Aminobacter aminovorans TaxID=83263 RepID=A0AAC8YVD2_AMIAI|nr:hypothetical protein AA2016_6260 [Aminobacter aminovorans]